MIAENNAFLFGGDETKMEIILNKNKAPQQNISKPTN